MNLRERAVNFYNYPGWHDGRFDALRDTTYAGFLALFTADISIQLAMITKSSPLFQDNPFALAFPTMGVLSASVIGKVGFDRFKDFLNIYSDAQIRQKVARGELLKPISPTPGLGMVRPNSNLRMRGKQ